MHTDRIKSNNQEIALGLILFSSNYVSVSSVFICVHLWLIIEFDSKISVAGNKKGQETFPALF